MAIWSMEMMRRAALAPCELAVWNNKKKKHQKLRTPPLRRNATCQLGLGHASLAAIYLYIGSRSLFHLWAADLLTCRPPYHTYDLLFLAAIYHYMPQAEAS